MIPNAFTRREFVSRGLVLASAAYSIPAFVSASAHAMTEALGGLTSLPGVPDDHILLVIQLGGGNDGLNTVIPFGMPEYYKARPAIGVEQKDVLKLSKADGIGLHPQLAPLRDLYDEGLLSVLQGVGYPNPNRSHFKSMDIWHTANLDANGDGWLGKYCDSECCGFGKGESGTREEGTKAPKHDSTESEDWDNAKGPPSLAIGRTAPLAMQGRLIKPVAFESAELFRWTGKDVHKSLVEPYDDLNRRAEHEGANAARPGSNADFLIRTALDAQVSSDLIRKAVAQKPLVTYPKSDLANQLSMIAQMIRAGLKTRVYYAQLGGFDTHAGQGGANGRHGQLLNQLAAATKAFYADLKEQRNDGRVLTMSFSEFGRRVSQNASGGTDHGTAAPLFLMGPMVRAGVVGEHPSLKDLDEGDLKYKIDFRSVYAGILDHWMKADSKKILGGTYKPVEIIRV